jgi:hypothetical protein
VWGSAASSVDGKSHYRMLFDSDSDCACHLDQVEVVVGSIAPESYGDLNLMRECKVRGFERLADYMDD